MSDSIKKQNVGVHIIKSAEDPVIKSDVVTQVTGEDAFNAGEWISQPVSMIGLRAMVDGSSILPQCIRVYKNNIAGFGIGVRYIDDEKETPERAAEFSKMQEIIELLNIDQDTKEVFEDVIEARETYGISYIEVLRNLKGEVNQIEFIKETPSIYKTIPLEPYIEVSYYHHGQEEKRRKKFCMYRQQIGGKTVYFKEFGDPRIMDWRDGHYLEKGEKLDLEFQANEIMEFAIGTQPYGQVRWIGQVLGVDGSRRAEQLNNNYFINGRHTPMMIIVKNGTMSDESMEKLRAYMNDIKGAAGQHAFLVLETEATDGKTDFDTTTSPDIEIKDLAGVLQKDELFQEYMDNTRRKVQSAFQLPDLYTGYTTDFNRATAMTAQEVTEEQVFQPERKSLAWAINNRLLNEYRFKYVEAYFLEPDVTNPDDLYKLLTFSNNAGGMTPNLARRVVLEALGQTSEDFPEDFSGTPWGDQPMAYSKQNAAQGQSAEGTLESPQEGTVDLAGALSQQLQEQIQKAARNNDDEIVAVMKEVRSLLVKAEDTGWRTINDTRVHFDDTGNIDMGPQGLKDWAARS